jgi:NTP pyrophosphatase (non-canonical NTP hydrolase)
MNIQDVKYSDFVAALAKPGDDIIKTLSAKKAHLLHMAVGISGEAGELLDAIKKHVIYNKPIDIENVKEELGDLLFYIQGIYNAIDVTQDEILAMNKEKLSVRYKNGYSDKAAQERADKA